MNGVFSSCLRDLRTSTSNLKFTKNNVRIQKYPRNRARQAQQMEMTFRTKRRNLPHTQSQPLSLVRQSHSTRNNFDLLYHKLEAQKQREADILNPLIS